MYNSPSHPHSKTIYSIFPAQEPHTKPTQSKLMHRCFATQNTIHHHPYKPHHSKRNIAIQFLSFCPHPSVVYIYLFALSTHSVDKSAALSRIYTPNGFGGVLLVCVMMIIILQDERRVFGRSFLGLYLVRRVGLHADRIR